MENKLKDDELAAARTNLGLWGRIFLSPGSRLVPAGQSRNAGRAIKNSRPRDKSEKNHRNKTSESTWTTVIFPERRGSRSQRPLVAIRRCADNETPHFPPIQFQSYLVERFIARLMIVFFPKEGRKIRSSEADKTGRRESVTWQRSLTIFQENK